MSTSHKVMNWISSNSILVGVFIIMTLWALVMFIYLDDVLSDKELEEVRCINESVLILTDSRDIEDTFVYAEGRRCMYKEKKTNRWFIDLRPQEPKHDSRNNSNNGVSSNQTNRHRHMPWFRILD